MWNDTDTPLAYLFTFRCYGTWLHGDERGTIDRFNNRYKSPYIAPNERWHRHNARTLKCEPVSLNVSQREAIKTAIRATCEVRNWLLRSVNARTNHVHVVVSIGKTKPSSALNALKSNATRQMRENGCWQQEQSPWSDKGSIRYLWNERSIERAVEYVASGQGGALPEFD